MTSAEAHHINVRLIAANIELVNCIRKRADTLSDDFARAGQFANEDTRIGLKRAHKALEKARIPITSPPIGSGSVPAKRRLFSKMTSMMQHELFSHLLPADLLRLARTESRMCTNLTLNKDNLSVWKYARNNVIVPVPPPGPEWTEPAWAQFIFGVDPCVICGQLTFRAPCSATTHLKLCDAYDCYRRMILSKVATHDMVLPNELRGLIPFLEPNSSFMINISAPERFVPELRLITFPKHMEKFKERLDFLAALHAWRCERRAGRLLTAFNLLSKFIEKEGDQEELMNCSPHETFVRGQDWKDLTEAAGEEYVWWKTQHSGGHIPLLDPNKKFLQNRIKNERWKKRDGFNSHVIQNRLALCFQTGTMMNEELWKVTRELAVPEIRARMDIRDTITDRYQLPALSIAETRRRLQDDIAPQANMKHPVRHNKLEKRRRGRMEVPVKKIAMTVAERAAHGKSVRAATARDKKNGRFLYCKTGRCLGLRDRRNPMDLNGLRSHVLTKHSIQNLEDHMFEMDVARQAKFEEVKIERAKEAEARKQADLQALHDRIEEQAIQAATAFQQEKQHSILAQQPTLDLTQTQTGNTSQTWHNGFLWRWNAHGAHWELAMGPQGPVTSHNFVGALPS